LRRHGRLRVHSHAGLHRLWRLHRNRPSDPGALQVEGRRAAGRRLRPRHVPRRQRTDRRRARDLGLPKKLASPKVAHEGDVVVCTLHYGSVLCVTATMGFKHRELDPAPLLKALARPNFMIKIIPHVDCTPRICELVRYYMEDVTVKGAWAGPAAIQLFEHALCDVARLPVREVVAATHYVTDLTLGLGEVVFDYLKDAS